MNIMSIFQRAQNTLLSAGAVTFNFASAPSDSQRDSLDILTPHVAFGAFDMSRNGHEAPEYPPDIQEAVLREISEWIHTSISQKPILWMNGPAGSGKSAFAHSVAEKTQELGYLLVGTFFFDRSDWERDTTERLIPSLAYQIISSIPPCREPILRAMIDNPNIFSLNLTIQVEKLIVEPLRFAGVLRASNTIPPMVIVVDGLDKCRDTDARAEFIQALTKCFDDSSFPLAILCSSCPESDIQTAFNDPRTSELSDRLVLNNHFSPDSEISAALEGHFSEMKGTHPLKGCIPQDWPSKSAIQTLIRKSSGQSSYASTAARYIVSKRHDPKERLDIILRIGSSSPTSPFKELDRLYRCILSSVPGDKRNTIARILGMINYPLSYGCLPITPAITDRVLKLPVGTTLNLLDLYDLRSVIHVDGSTKTLKFFHPAFSEFLNDRSRSGVFSTDPNLSLADHTLAYFKYLLNEHAVISAKLVPPKEICKVLTSGLLEFFGDVPWKDAFTRNLPKGYLFRLETFTPRRPCPSNLCYRVSAVRHLIELYNFCKMGSQTSPAWTPAYQRAREHIAAWITEDIKLTLATASQEAKEDFRNSVRLAYVHHLLSLSPEDDYQCLEFCDLVLDVLRTPGLSCIYHINRARHNFAICDLILETLLTGIFPPRYHIQPARKSQIIQGWECIAQVAKLLDLSDRTAYLDTLLPYIEKEASLASSMSEAMDHNGVEEFQAAISRYKEKLIDQDYDRDFNFSIGIELLAARYRTSTNPADSFSGVFPYCFTF